MPNLFNRIWTYLKRDLSWTDPKAWDSSLWNLAGSQSISGENVNESTALTYSAVYNAVSLISGTIAALPLHLMRRFSNKKEIANDRAAYRVLHDYANPFMTALSFRETMMAHILIWGNCYAEKVWNGYGEVIQLWPIPPDRVTVSLEGGRVLYTIDMKNGQKVVFPREKILHIPGLGYDGFQGYSVISMARKSLGLGMALETFGSNFFGNGTHPGTIVSHPGKLSQLAHANLETSLTDGYSGLGKSHKLLLLEEGMKLEQLGVPPNDSQFLESRQFQIPEVARWFNLPPHKLKDLTRSSFSNIESEQISFVTDSILPWLVRLEQNYNLQLLPESERDFSLGETYYFKHSVEGLLRSDAASRANFYSRMFNIGVFSINEIRALEDMDPIEEGDGHYVPLNMVSVESIDDMENQPKLPVLSPKMIPGKGNGKDVEA